MTRLILSLLALALVAIPVSIQWAPPDPGTLAFDHGGRYQLRLYAAYEDPLHSAYFVSDSTTGWYRDGSLWRFVVDGADAGSIQLDFGSPQTITTTAAQDASLTRLLAKINAERGGSSGLVPYATVEAWLKATLQSAIQSYRDQAAKADAEDACVTYNAASTVVQNQIKTALRGKSPCL